MAHADALNLVHACQGPQTRCKVTHTQAYRHDRDHANNIVAVLSVWYTARNALMSQVGLLYNEQAADSCRQPVEGPMSGRNACKDPSCNPSYAPWALEHMSPIWHMAPS